MCRNCEIRTLLLFLLLGRPCSSFFPFFPFASFVPPSGSVTCHRGGGGGRGCCFCSSNLSPPFLRMKKAKEPSFPFFLYFSCLQPPPPPPSHLFRSFDLLQRGWDIPLLPSPALCVPSLLGDEKEKKGRDWRLDRGGWRERGGEGERALQKRRRRP